MKRLVALLIAIVLLCTISASFAFAADSDLKAHV